MNNLSAEEMQKIYREIHDKLVAPFPEGTVDSHERDSNSRFIPVQAYINRLEEASGAFWSWRLTGSPIIYEAEDLVQVTGVLKIVDAEREGIGYSNLQRYPDTKKIRNLKDAIRSASSDAIRDACSLYQIGWKDLAPYRKWASNPGVGLIAPNKKQDASEGRACLRCKNKLTTEDEAFLRQINVSMAYCQNHVPDHLTRNKK
jgi:hypothetical protein